MTIQMKATKQYFLVVLVFMLYKVVQTPLIETVDEFLKCDHVIALFTDNFTHLHYNTIQRGHEAISGYFVIFPRNCLAFVFKFIVIQM